MTQEPPTGNASRVGTLRGKPLVPPDEQFWVRYSPHHEFPLSSITSITLHLLLILLLLVGIWLAWKLGWTEDTRGVPIDPVVLEGGGSGPGTGPDKGVQGGLPGEDVPNPGANNPGPGVDANGPPDLRNPIEGKRPVPPAGGGWREGLDALNGVLGTKRAGGPGRDTGDDVGVGPKKGPGVSERTRERQRRWTLIFNTRDGQDYVRQLNALGAILVYPDPQEKNEFRVIRNLRERPVTAKIEDVAQIQRMYWVDDTETSVRSLSAALGLKPTPPGFGMFFPADLEPRLLKLELTYRGRAEQEIEETKFEVFKNPEGQYDIRVISQTPKRR
jgi:hypothetical protein